MMIDPIEATALTVGSVAAGVSFTADAIEDVADVVVDVNRGIRKLVRLFLVLTVVGIAVVVVAAAMRRFNEQRNDDVAY